MHWHWGSDSSKGSEHTIDGKEYPIEIHLVHVNTKYYDANGAPSDDTFSMPDGLAVLGIMYEVSTEDNANLTSILSKVMMNAIVMLHTVWVVKIRATKNLVQGERGCCGAEAKAQGRESWSC